MRMFAIPLALLAAGACLASEEGAVSGDARCEQRASLEGREAILRDCVLAEVAVGGERELYRFGDASTCQLLETNGNVRIFNTDSGVVVPLEVCIQADGIERARAMALIWTGEDFALSRGYYQRRGCGSFPWPEKSFHVLAVETWRLPAAGLVFVERH